MLKSQKERRNVVLNTGEKAICVRKGQKKKILAELNATAGQKKKKKAINLNI